MDVSGTHSVSAYVRIKYLKKSIYSNTALEEERTHFFRKQGEIFINRHSFISLKT